MRGVSCLMAKQSSIKKEDKVERGIGSEQSKLRLSVTVGRDGRTAIRLASILHTSHAGAFFWVKESESVMRVYDSTTHLWIKFDQFPTVLLRIVL